MNRTPSSLGAWVALLLWPAIAAAAVDFQWHVTIPARDGSGGVVAHESMRDARLVTVRLFHDDAHPSALFVLMNSTQR